jgi:hypothetical protein
VLIMRTLYQPQYTRWRFTRGPGRSLRVANEYEGKINKWLAE